MTVVSLRSVSARYPGRSESVLRELDLDVAAGEIVGITGPSGIGKTSVLRVLSGLLPPLGGEVLLDGRPCWVTRRRRVSRGAPRFRVPGAAVVPILQDPVSSLDPRWPVWRSVAESLPSGTPRTRRRLVARNRLDSLGLSHLDLEARPGQLSVGQCQRVALARAVVAQPRLLLADEPTSALDATNAAGVLDALNQGARRGAAVIIVSHHRAALAAVCDRVVVMRNGGVHPDDTGGGRGSGIGVTTG